MEGLMIKNLYSLEETIAADLFDGLDYPWQVLPKIGEFILKLGPTLPEDEYDQVGEDVWIAKSATVFPSAYVHGPAIIGKRGGSPSLCFYSGMAIVGEGSRCGKFHRA